MPLKIDPCSLFGVLCYIIIYISSNITHTASKIQNNRLQSLLLTPAECLTAFLMFNVTLELENIRGKTRMHFLHKISSTFIKINGGSWCVRRNVIKLHQGQALISLTLNSQRISYLFDVFYLKYHSCMRINPIRYY